MRKTLQYYKFAVFLFVFLIQLYSPKIYMGSSISVTPDFLLIYLTCMSIYCNRLHLILIGFSIGFIQDIMTQYNLLGLFAFSKTIMGFMLGTLYKYNKIWKKNIKIIFLFFTYILHFLISSYFMFERSFIPLSYVLKISLLESVWMFFVLLMVNKFVLIDKKIIE